MKIGDTIAFHDSTLEADWHGVKCVQLPFDGGKGWIFGKYGGGEWMTLDEDEYTPNDMRHYIVENVLDGATPWDKLEYQKENRKMKDGWHTICGWRVLVDNNRVTMGIGGEKPIYPYRWSKKENCWVNVAPVAVAAFRTGIKRGTIQMF